MSASYHRTVAPHAPVVLYAAATQMAPQQSAIRTVPPRGVEEETGLHPFSWPFLPSNATGTVLLRVLGGPLRGLRVTCTALSSSIQNQLCSSTPLKSKGRKSGSCKVLSLAVAVPYIHGERLDERRQDYQHNYFGLKGMPDARSTYPSCTRTASWARNLHPFGEKGNGKCREWACSLRVIYDEHYSLNYVFGPVNP
ncbi:hypothetical protein C7212DRAFT_347783 [Tuber magnatum]|uniref:Uncharacterized protein n=1 Tax=Tuber magnatum TaxID=42249 RepID=A0A317SFN2_9PEZI|nr:hypothetical protein C7212DRAFT_347783 [Tuber magnatum]